MTNITRAGLVLAAIVTGLVLAARKEESEPSHVVTSATTANVDDAVHVSLRRLASDTPAVRRYALSYGKGADTSRILFSYDTSQATPASAIAISRGTFSPVGGSKAAPLLEALAVMHEAQPQSTEGFGSSEDVTVDVGILGTGLSLASAQTSTVAGAFTSARPGPWTVLKLFFPSLDENVGQPELFLALNEAGEEARFLWKDPEYWPTLAPTLAGLLAGKVR